ncbi:hypothetical protein Tco_0344744 [Tanacetum coccineum]
MVPNFGPPIFAMLLSRLIQSQYLNKPSRTLSPLQGVKSMIMFMDPIEISTMNPEQGKGKEDCLILGDLLISSSLSSCAPPA